MPFAVEMYMDAGSEASIRRMWEALAEGGVKSAMLDAGYRPHVSLGVCEELVDGLARELSSFADGLSPFALTLSSIGLFPSSAGVIFLGVTPTQKLLDVNGAFHQFFGKYAKAQREHYQIGKWVPHCTLAFDLSDGMLAEAIAVCRRMPLPIHSRIEEIGVAEVSPSSARLLCLYNLKG